jgi:hypothetical protein
MRPLNPDPGGSQAQFQVCTPRELPILARSPVPCTAVVIACFREDGNVLLLQPTTPGQAWDLPHGPLPAGHNPITYSSALLTTLSGIAPAEPLYLFGIIDWGAAARASGWGWTACLFGQVGRMTRLPKSSWACRRAFLPSAEALARTSPDSWQRLRRETLEQAVAVFESLRDFWLVASLDAVSRSDLDDLLE